MAERRHVFIDGLGHGLNSSPPGAVATGAEDSADLVGGLLYTFGALAHARQWPTIFWPDVLGPHQLLHLFVLSASATHFCFMLWYVAPYQRLVVVAQRKNAERQLVEAGVR